MTSPSVERFDAERVASLRARTADALDDLDGITSRDPAAQHAMQVLRLTRRTLDSFWVPALDRIIDGPVESGPDRVG